MQAIPKPGQMVIVRNRPGIVRDIEVADNGGTEGALHAVRVEYIDGWNYPEIEQVIWEKEWQNRILASLTMPQIDNPAVLPDHYDRLHAFLNANRWSAVNRLVPPHQEMSDTFLISPWQSAVQVEDYQLYPVLKSLLMPRISLLLADDVGLGKTIEAGMIVSELFCRRRIRRVLVVCPASLLRQWQDELREKLYLDFTIVDSDQTFQLKRTLGLDSNPWATYPRIITSMDYLRQQDVLESFRAATDTLVGKDTAQLPWQMLVVDEAHNFLPSRFGDESDRCQMLRQISSYFEHRLFLTATPHNGYTVSFTGLLELLDPVRFQQTAAMEESDHAQLELSMVRRLKSELTGNGHVNRFPKRYVDGLPIRVQGSEKALYDALRDYRHAVLGLLGSVGRREKHVGDFLLMLLTKRLLSSTYAFACTWWQHVAGAELGTVETDEVDHARSRAEAPLNDDVEREQREQDALRQGGAWLLRFTDKISPQVERVGECLKALGWDEDTIQRSLRNDDSSKDPTWKKIIKAICENKNVIPPDAKWDRLAEWVDENLRTIERFKDDERLIVFTEYKSTLDYLMMRFGDLGLESPIVEDLYGGASAARREQIKEAFNDPDSPIRILVATDVASEGLNLQHSCRYVIHQDIPWNPMRLDQRNGRLDRYGQARDVYAYHFTSDDEADLKFLSRVVRKVEQVREDLGNVGQLIDRAIMEHFTVRELDPDSLDARADLACKTTPEHEDANRRDRGGENEYTTALQQLRATELGLGLQPESLAALLSHAVALEKGELKPTSEDPQVFRFLTVPPAWKKLIRETLEIKKGKLAGSLPKLVFDPGYFEVTENNRTIFRQRPDTALIRLGHPIMRRSVATLKRCMWEEGKLARWTIEKSPLPRGIDEILVLHLMLEATNSLKEVIHAEIITVPFQVLGDRLTTIDENLWRQVEPLNRYELAPAKLSKWQATVADQWLSHSSRIKDYVAEQKKEFEKQFQSNMGIYLKQALDYENKRFQSRQKELTQRQNQGKSGKVYKELEKQRQRLQQIALLPEIQAEEEQRLCDLEWQAYHSDTARLKRLLESEQKRMLEGVLPKRYELAWIDLQPLAIEYVIRDSERDS